jgi:hypothetical protein
MRMALSILMGDLDYGNASTLALLSDSAE